MSRPSPWPLLTSPNRVTFLLRRSCHAHPSSPTPSIRCAWPAVQHLMAIDPPSESATGDTSLTLQTTLGPTPSQPATDRSSHPSCSMSAQLHAVH